MRSIASFVFALSIILVASLQTETPEKELIGWQGEKAHATKPEGKRW
jgi:hypothetical protein